MRTTVVLAASFALAATGSAFAGNATKVKKTVENTAAVAASARTAEYQFDLKKTKSTNIQNLPRDLGEVFATNSEVALESYSFNLK